MKLTEQDLERIRRGYIETMSAKFPVTQWSATLSWGDFILIVNNCETFECKDTPLPRDPVEIALVAGRLVEKLRTLP